MAEAVEMARGLWQAGYSTVYCTPHLVKGSYEADNGTVRTAVATLQSELARQQIGLELFPGREYYLDEFLIDYLKNPLPLGTTKFILVEIPNQMPVSVVKDTCYRIKCSGFIPMIAHPERCELFVIPERQTDGWFKVLVSMFKVRSSEQDVERLTSNVERSNNPLLDYLRDIGCMFQGNLGSLAGIYGARVRVRAETFLAAGIYSHFGSDLHSVRQAEILAVRQRLPMEK